MEAAPETRPDDGLGLPPELLRRVGRLAIAVRKTQRGAAKGERRSKRKGSSVEFADYRDYVQGDDLRHIDWNIYGRLDAMYLKLFQEQEDLVVHLLVDTSKSMDFGTPKKFDFACQFAGVLGYIGLTGYDRVAVQAICGAEPGRYMPPLRGKAAVRKLFTFLGGLDAGGATNLGPACRNHALRARGKGIAVLISDFLDENGFEDALKQLAGCGTEAYAIHVLSPEEMDPDLAGDLKLVDSESGAFAEVSVSRALMKRYRKNRDAFINDVRRHCHARGISYFLVPSDTSLEQLTLDVLRKGGLLR